MDDTSSIKGASSPLSVLFQGFLIGIGNIIPGVSGGTIALILGIYERIINGLHNISLETFQVGLAFVLRKEGSQERLKEELKKIDFLFFLTLGLGAMIALFSLAFLITHLIQNHHAPTLGFFAGLVLASVAVPYKLIKRHSWRELLMGIIAIVLVVTLSLYQSESNKVEKEKRKQLRKATAEKVNLVKTSKTEWGNYLKKDFPQYLLAGAVAISAMILPGISGSFIMLLMGVYFEIVQGLKGLNLFIIIPFSLGCALGLIFFSRFLNFIFSKYYSLTLAFLTGLIIGSLYELWPFKNPVDVNGVIVYGDNIYNPVLSNNVWLTGATFVIGFLIVCSFYYYEKKTSK